MATGFFKNKTEEDIVFMGNLCCVLTFLLMSKYLFAVIRPVEFFSYLLIIFSSSFPIKKKQLLRLEPLIFFPKPHSLPPSHLNLFSRVLCRCDYASIFFFPLKHSDKRNDFNVSMVSTMENIFLYVALV